MAYANLTDIRRYLGITSTDDDVLLSEMLDAATTAIDNATGRTFSAVTATARYFDATRDVDGALLHFDTDCCGITSVVNGDSVTITSAYYATEPRNVTPYYALRLTASSGYSWTYTTDPENAITITGYWAWSRTPPNDIRLACIRWAGYMYRQKDSQVYSVQSYVPDQGMIITPDDMPRDVVRLLRPYMRLTI